MKKTILVTGGAGFIGSNLIEALLKAGNRVISLDDYSSGKKENHIAGAKYIEGSTKDIQSLIKEKIELVYHLGEYSRVERSFDDIEKVFDSNLRGTPAVLEFCRKQNCKIVYAGSSTKFADDGLGIDQSPYAWSKATNTELVKNYGAWFNLPFAITYFYNVYGPRENATGPYATVIAIFKEQSKKGEPLTVVAPGTQTRNFTHVQDIVRGLLLVGEKGEGDGYGLGNKESHSILDVAKMFGGEIKMLPERKGNRMAGDLETAKTEKEFGWEAKIDLATHLKEFKKS